MRKETLHISQFVDDVPAGFSAEILWLGVGDGVASLMMCNSLEWYNVGWQGYGLWHRSLLGDSTS